MSEKISFKRQDICAIIEKCSECGVAEFQMGELKFSFNAKKKVITKEHLPSKAIEGPKTLEVSPEIDEEIDNSKKLAELEAEIIEMEYELSTMHIADPELHEELVATGKIEEMEQLLGEKYVELDSSRA
jgi:hypothetical protein